MNRTTMLATLREVLNDASTSFNSWSDARLLMYLSEGQDKFCEETGYFRDASSFTLTLESGTATYAVPSRIIELIGVYNGTKPLTKLVTNGAFLESDTRVAGETQLHTLIDIALNYIKSEEQK